MKKPSYPLEQVLEVKKDRVDKAHKVFLEKKKALDIENEKLKKCEAERDAVLHHHNDKLSQLRHAMDTQTTSEEVLQMKGYLKTVKEKLQKEEVKVQKQKEQVKNAQKALDLASEELKRKRIEEEKIKMHKEEWEKEFAKEHLKHETRYDDEIGTTIHEKERRKKEK